MHRRGVCVEYFLRPPLCRSVYSVVLSSPIRLTSCPFVSQTKLELEYKGRKLRSTYQPDLICFGKIVVERKAVSTLTDEHRAQLHNYLKASGLGLGLLVNFGHHPKIQIERIIR